MLVLLACLPSVALAQGGGSRLVGVVFDSLFTRRPLAEADVWVEGTDLRTRTDGRGRFTLDDVPPSRHRIVAWHPRLDSAGVSAPTRTVDLAGLPSAYLTLATPDARTVYARQCPGTRAASTGVLLATLVDAERGTPAAGVTAEARWSEWTIGGRGTAERQIRAQADSAGRVRLCGVPTDVALAVLAIGDRSAGPVDVHLQSVAVGRIELAVGRAGASARLSGRVTTAEGRPIAGATVRLLGLDVDALTGADGDYVLAASRTGTATLEVRAIGHAPVRRRTVLAAGVTGRADVALARTAVALPEVSVTGRPVSVTDLSGFEVRRRGGRGTFLDDAAIRQRRASTTADLFKGMPGVDVTITGVNGVVLFRRAEGQVGKYGNGTCHPQYYVDGVPRELGREDPATGDLVPIGQVLQGQGTFTPDVGPGQLVRLEDLAAVEVYRGAADVPPQFARLDAGCGVILLWTKRGKPSAAFRAPETPTVPLPERDAP